MKKNVNEIDVSKAIGLIVAARETLVDEDGDMINDENATADRILCLALEELNALNK